MVKVQRLGVEIIQSIHTHESKDIISVVGNNHKTLRDRLRKIDDFVTYKGYKLKNNK